MSRHGAGEQTWPELRRILPDGPDGVSVLETGDGRQLMEGSKVRAHDDGTVTIGGSNVASEEQGRIVVSGTEVR